MTLRRLLRGGLWLLAELFLFGHRRVLVVFNGRKVLWTELRDTKEVVRTG